MKTILGCTVIQLILVEINQYMKYKYQIIILSKKFIIFNYINLGKSSLRIMLTKILSNLLTIELKFKNCIFEGVVLNSLG